MKSKKPLYVYLILFSILFYNNLSAQVPVRDEPHHKVVLENEYVRLIDVHIASNDTTVTHIHAAPSVIVFLSKTIIGTQIVGDKPNISDVNPGQTSYAAYDEKPIKHRVWNQGSSMFHVMDIELVKQKANDDSCSIISQKGIKLQWIQKLVRTYNISMKQGKEYEIPKSNCAHLLIDISGIVSAVSPGSVRMMKDGSFVFFPPQSEIKISSNNPNAECVLLELK
ncbi:MAG TPA: hypothetical protein VKT28_13125 [Puia sp.]|nr:hypothetical protein [Puia sp.]